MALSADWHWGVGVCVFVEKQKRTSSGFCRVSSVAGGGKAEPEARDVARARMSCARVTHDTHDTTADRERREPDGVRWWGPTQPAPGYTFENPQRPSLLVTSDKNSVTISISRLYNTTCCDRGLPIFFHERRRLSRTPSPASHGQTPTFEKQATDTPPPRGLADSTAPSARLAQTTHLERAVSTHCATSASLTPPLHLSFQAASSNQHRFPTGFACSSLPSSAQARSHRCRLYSGHASSAQARSHRCRRRAVRAHMARPF